MTVGINVHIDGATKIEAKCSKDGSVHWVRVMVGAGCSDLSIFTPTGALAVRLAETLRAIRSAS